VGTKVKKSKRKHGRPGHKLRAPRAPKVKKDKSPKPPKVQKTKPGNPSFASEALNDALVEKADLEVQVESLRNALQAVADATSKARTGSGKEAHSIATEALS
jgi:hypothetical protein